MAQADTAAGAASGRASLFANVSNSPQGARDTQKE